MEGPFSLRIPNQEVEEEFCRLRLLLSPLGENTVPQSGCT